MACAAVTDETESSDLDPPLEPAATLIVMRELRRGMPELLMVERAAGMAFAGGALVFPGGRVEPGDQDFAARMGAGDLDEAAARIAAIRETIEEAGVAIGLDPADVAALEVLRSNLHAGRPIGAMLTGVAQLDALVPFARWVPRQLARRRFDTRFYLARSPEDAEARADAGESVRLIWASARDILAEDDAGRARLIFPTRRNLERLAQFASFDEAAAHARASPRHIVTPWIEAREGIDHLCIPEGLGYPITAEPLDRVRRG